MGNYFLPQSPDWIVAVAARHRARGYRRNYLHLGQDPRSLSCPRLPLECNDPVRPLHHFYAIIHRRYRADIGGLALSRLDAGSAGQNGPAIFHEFVYLLFGVEFFMRDALYFDPGAHQEYRHFMSFLERSISETNSIPGLFGIIGLDYQTKFHSSAPCRSREHTSHLNTTFIIEALAKVSFVRASPVKVLRSTEPF